MATPQSRSSVRVDVRTAIKRNFDMMRGWRQISLVAAVEEAMALWVLVQEARRKGQMTPELEKAIKVSSNPGPASLGHLG
jgi:hypothetical protein